MYPGISETYSPQPPLHGSLLITMGTPCLAPSKKKGNKKRKDNGNTNERPTATPHQGDPNDRTDNDADVVSADDAQSSAGATVGHYLCTEPKNVY